MILGLGGHVGIWAAQALSLGAAFPPLHPCWNTGKLVIFSRESDVWIFMYNLLILFYFFNLLILMLATSFCFSRKKKKKWERNLHSDVLESAFSLCNFLFLA